MLSTLRINNLALIEKAVVNFDDGFNVLTGETGAGKSLLVDALLFLTGIRADKSLIQSGKDFARVDGVFTVDTTDRDINDIMSTIGLDNDGTIVISRYFSLSGKNECRINGELVTLNIIKKLSAILLDIFGQNDSLVLLDPDKHLALTDAMFADLLVEPKNRLGRELDSLHLIDAKIKELGGLDADRENNIRLLQFEIEEIDNADLSIGLEEELKSKILVMENSEKIHRVLSDTEELLNGEYSIPNAIKIATNNIQQVENLNTKYLEIKNRLSSVKYELEDIVDSISKMKDDIYYSESELDMLNDRLQSIKDLERKYGKTIADVLEKRQELQNRLHILLSADVELERLRDEKKQCLNKILDICNELHNIRVQEIAKFREKLVAELRGLGMKNAKFDAVFTQSFDINNIENIVSSDGADKIEYMFSANLGVELRPLSKIISGGEMSRFMLGFKSIQNAEKHKTCIFDEIDAGIGGEIGGVVGQKISNVSKYNQVICITHLPTIAVYADNNYKIAKHDENGVTVTTVSHLNTDEKVVEIARMLGNSTSATTIAHAQDIITDAMRYKALNA